MKKIVSTGLEAQARTVAGLIADAVRKKPDALLCLAAGDTPTAAYAEMARMQCAGEADFRACRLIGLDEWIGMDEHADGGCKKYIYEHVVRPLELAEEHIFFFNACAEDLARECAKADAYLEQNGSIDISLMGVGMNGHIALNEPGCDFRAGAHVVSLDHVTRETAQKYFQHPTPVTQGITLGMGQIRDSHLLIVMANGEKKRSVMHAALYGGVTNAVPASALQMHPNCIVSVDEKADSSVI